MGHLGLSHWLSSHDNTVMRTAIAWFCPCILAAVSVMCLITSFD